MKELKRMSYKKIAEQLENLGFECYQIEARELNLEGATSGLQGIKEKEDFMLVLRKYKNSNVYVVELDTENQFMIDYVKNYFNQFSNIDYLMINGE